MICNICEPAHISDDERNGFAFLASFGLFGEPLVDETKVVANHMSSVDVDIE